MSNESNFAGKLKDSLFWWLGFKKPFIINDEYKIELLYIDKVHKSIKIKITNLKSKEEVTL
jgi:hypothetical protein